MSRPRSRFVEPCCALVAGLLSWPHSALAQACCAGSGVVTPGRLALHDSALVGVQFKAALEHGSFDDHGAYYGLPHGASELDLEQDWFAALRVVERGQVALLVPLAESRRTSAGRSEFGGGIADLNLNFRYDFVRAGESVWLPGIGVLTGLTFPTGTPPDAPHLRPLATDATGIGAFQANLGLALEQAFGPWLVTATGMVAKRTARTVQQAGLEVHEQLASQWTALAACAYVFPSEVALALSASYTVEGQATINGQLAPGSARRATALSASSLLPVGDHVRLQASLWDNPPIAHTSSNQLASVGVGATAVYAWF